MAYGLSVINAAGDEVFDPENQMMSLKPQGVCILESTYYPYVAATIRYDPRSASPVPKSTHYAVTGWEAGVNSSGASIHVPLAENSKSDFSFVELPAAGIFRAAGINQKVAGFTAGTFAGYMAAANIPAMRYVVATTTPGAPSGNYGLQLFDSAGVVTFDSRHKKLGIQDALFISQAQFADVIHNNAVINLPLSAPTPNCLVYMPFWTNIRTGIYTTSGVCSVKLTQLNATTLQISRFAEMPYSATNPFYYEYFHDAIILVARNILI